MKIEFKSLKGLDLTKVFPVIVADDYKLIEGHSLVISDPEYKKIEKQGYFEIGGVQVSKDLIQVAKGETYDPVRQVVADKVNETCLYADDMIEALFKAMQLNQNVLMYGRGGHNKSEGTMTILEEMRQAGVINSKPFVMAFGDGLTEEALFGGIQIKKFRDSGELEYLVKNSFMEHEIVVFEELFDAPPQILLSLKDIMTSGWFRKGNQTHKVKTKIIIGLTNKSKSDFSEDESLEALAQRFPLTLKVEWESYGKKDWRALFDKVFDAEFNKTHKYKLEELAEILTQNNVNGNTFVSPRTAVHAAKLYASGGNLKFISDIDKSTLDAYYKANKDSQKEKEDENMFNMIDDYIKSNNLGDIDTNAKLLDIILGEHKSRTGEEIVVEQDTNSNLIKANKLKFAKGLMDIHSWSAKNMDKAKRKKQEILDLISTIES